MSCTVVATSSEACGDATSPINSPALMSWIGKFGGRGELGLGTVGRLCGWLARCVVKARHLVGSRLGSFQTIGPARVSWWIVRLRVYLVGWLPPSLASRLLERLAGWLSGGHNLWNKCLVNCWTAGWMGVSGCLIEHSCGRI